MANKQLQGRLFGDAPPRPPSPARMNDLRKHRGCACLRSSIHGASQRVARRSRRSPRPPWRSKQSYLTVHIHSGLMATAMDLGGGAPARVSLFHVIWLPLSTTHPRHEPTSARSVKSHQMWLGGTRLRVISRWLLLRFPLTPPSIRPEEARGQRGDRRCLCSNRGWT